MQTITELYTKHGNDVQVKKTLNYLRELSAAAGKDIGDWDIGSIFKGEGVGGLSSSPTEMNRIFFAHLKKTESAKPKLTRLTEDQHKNILIAEERFNKAEMDRLDSAIVASTRRIRDSIKNLEVIGTELRNYEDQKRTIKSRTSVAEMIEGVLAIGFYTFDGIDVGHYSDDDTWLKFTTEPVVLTYKRKDGKSFTVPFGQFRVKISLKRPRVRCECYKNNVFYNGYYHPFVSNSGDICFGTAGEIAVKLLSQSKFVDWFRLFKSLITTFSDGAYPYVSMESMYFQARDEKGQHPWRAANDTSPDFQSSEEAEELDCNRCGGDHHTDDCDEPYCERCEDYGHDEDSCEREP